MKLLAVTFCLVLSGCFSKYEVQAVSAEGVTYSASVVSMRDVGKVNFTFEKDKGVALEMEGVSASDPIKAQADAITTLSKALGAKP